MSLIRWDPWREFEDVFDRYSRAIGRPLGQSMELLSGGDWTPRADIAETDRNYQIKLELPEVNKQDVKISVDNGVLTIRGERHQEKEEKGKKFHRVERFYGSFVRSFTLPDNGDEAHIDATFKDGMLTLTVPKLEKATPKAIEISVH